MTQDLGALIHLSTKGNEAATQELFDRGQKASDDGDFKTAAMYFKEAAISFRIAAFGQQARKEALSNALKGSESIKDNLTELLVSCIDAAGVETPTTDIDSGALKEMVHSHILCSRPLAPIVDLLRWRLTKLDQAHDGPHSSFETRLLILLGLSLGAAGYTSRMEPSMEDPIVREIMKRIAADAVERLPPHDDVKPIR
jgi:hypothetical protein